MVSSKHRATLAAIFERPTRANIKWKDVRSMIIAFDGELAEGAGSRVRIKLNGVRMTLHAPHPAPDMDKGAVTSLRQFLERAGQLP